MNTLSIELDNIIGADGPGHIAILLAATSIIFSLCLASAFLQHRMRRFLQKEKLLRKFNDSADKFLSNAASPDYLKDLSKQILDVVSDSKNKIYLVDFYHLSPKNSSATSVLKFEIAMLQQKDPHLARLFRKNVIISALLLTIERKHQFSRQDLRTVKAELVKWAQQRVSGFPRKRPDINVLSQRKTVS